MAHPRSPQLRHLLPLRRHLEQSAQLAGLRRPGQLAGPRRGISGRPPAVPLLVPGRLRLLRQRRPRRHVLRHGAAPDRLSLERHCAPPDGDHHAHPAAGPAAVCPARLRHQLSLRMVRCQRRPRPPAGQKNRIPQPAVVRPARHHRHRPLEPVFLAPVRQLASPGRIRLARVHPRRQPLERPRPVRALHHRFARRLRLGYVARPALVVDHVRRLLPGRRRCRLHGHPDRHLPGPALGGLSHQLHQRGALPRPRQVALRPHRVLGLRFVLPVHAHLVLEPARRGGLVSAPAGRLLELVPAVHGRLPLRYSVLRADAARKQGATSPSSAPSPAG